MSNWTKTYYRGAVKAAKVDREANVIRDVVVVQQGEAKGHGHHLDEEFIDQVIKFGNGHGPGMKSRLGHPSMSDDALGTELGRFTNFRRRGKSAVADLHLGSYASKSPKGDLPEYILSFAEEDPSAFGASIVFSPGKTYQRDEKGRKIYKWRIDSDGYRQRNKKWQDGSPQFIEIKALHAVDLVDTPAATSGLFSQFNMHAYAVRISEFLDNNPDIDQFLSEHPNLEGKFIDFFTKRTKMDENQFQKTTTEERLSGIEKGIEFLKGMFSVKNPETTPEPETQALSREGILEAENDELRAENEALQQRLSALETQLSLAIDEVKKLSKKPSATPPAQQASETTARSKGNDIVNRFSTINSEVEKKWNRMGYNKD